jgi:hypothetical protein
VRKRAFGSLKYEHLHSHEITDGPTIAVEAERYRQVFNTVRPHEALDMARPAERYLAPVRPRTPTPQPSTQPSPNPANFVTRDTIPRVTMLRRAAAYSRRLPSGSVTLSRTSASIRVRS